MPEQKPVPSRRMMSYIVTYVRVELVVTTDVQRLLRKLRPPKVKT